MWPIGTLTNVAPVDAVPGDVRLRPLPFLKIYPKPANMLKKKTRKLRGGKTLEDRIAPAMLRSVPQLLFSIFLLRWVGWGHLALGPPASAAAGLLSLLSVSAGTTVSATLSVVAMSTLFWTISGSGVSTVFGIAVWLFSGIVIPLPLLPHWVQPVMRVLPFRAMVDVPFRIYVGDIAGIQILIEILGQLVHCQLFAL